MSFQGRLNLLENVNFFLKIVQFLEICKCLLFAFRMYSRNIIGRNPSMVIPLLANQDLTPMLGIYRSFRHHVSVLKSEK